MAISRKRWTLVAFCGKRLEPQLWQAQQLKVGQKLICCKGLIGSEKRSYEQNLLFEITSKIIFSMTCSLNNGTLQNVNLLWRLLETYLLLLLTSGRRLGKIGAKHHDPPCTSQVRWYPSNQCHVAVCQHMTVLAAFLRLFHAWGSRLPVGAQEMLCLYIHVRPVLVCFSE